MKSREASGHPDETVLDRLQPERIVAESASLVAERVELKSTEPVSAAVEVAANEVGLEAANWPDHSHRVALASELSKTKI